MKVVDLPLESLNEASWNPNQMDEAMVSRLRQSIGRYGLVENIVVRCLGGGTYEVLSGNWRLSVLREMGVHTVACVIVDVDDAHARLLAQALNHIHGEDDLGLRTQLLKEVLDAIPQDDVLKLLPETALSLSAITSLSQEDIAHYLEVWQKAQAARLKHLTFQLTPPQLQVIEEALAQALPLAKQSQGQSPNVKGTALHFICNWYLQQGGHQ